MATDEILYAELDERARSYLESARTAAASMRDFLVAHHGLKKKATVPELVREAIACGELAIREQPGQQEALGVALGDELTRRLGWSWMIVTDPWGTAPAVVAPGVRAQAYPLDWVGKRLDDGGDFDDVPEWFERLLVACQESANGAGARK